MRRSTIAMLSVAAVASLLAFVLELLFAIGSR
jgi:hypothetical protein